jgi:glutathione S-transferase
MQTQSHAHDKVAAAGVALYWHFPMSYNSHKASVALAETGFAVEKRAVDLLGAHHLRPAYMAVNPKGLVPCLQLAGGTTLADSADIVMYLGEHATDRISLLPPPGSAARKVAEEWFARARALPIERLTYARKALPGGPGLIDLRIKTIRDCLADPATPHELLPHYQTRLDGYLTSAKGFQSRGESEYTHAMREELEDGVRKQVDELDSLLSSDARPFIAGDVYSIADCMWTAVLARLGLVGLTGWWSDGQRTAVAAYFERLRARPSYALAGVVHDRVRRPE